MPSFLERGGFYEVTFRDPQVLFGRGRFVKQFSQILKFYSGVGEGGRGSKPLSDILKFSRGQGFCEVTFRDPQVLFGGGGSMN